MKLLVDTNIILDFLIQRDPFFREAESLFQAREAGRIAIYVTPITVVQIFDIAKLHTESMEQAKAAIASTLAAFEICLLDRTVLQLASWELGLASPTPEFEDAIKIACALSQGLDAIVSRNADFSHPSIPVWSVKEIIRRTGMIH